MSERKNEDEPIPVNHGWYTSIEIKVPLEELIKKSEWKLLPPDIIHVDLTRGEE